MTYFEENIACKVSMEEEYFSTLGKYQIPYPEYTASCGASLGCAAALAAKHLGAPWSPWLSRSSGVSKLSWSGSIT